jgi:hypothetical protein
MRLAFPLTGLALMLAGCGVDGEPEPPTRASTLVLSTNGAAIGTGVAYGPVSFNLGLGL